MLFYNPSQNFKQSFSTTHWHRILFVFFLFSLPFSIRKVFGVFSPDGSFNEYLDISLYFSDVLLMITLLVYILENKITLLSISYWRKMFHVEHLFLPILIPTFFILWLGLSVFWSENVPLAEVALFRLIEGYLLYLYIIVNNVPRGISGDQYAKCSTWNNRIEHTDVEMFHVEHLGTNMQNVPRGTFITMALEYVLKCSTWNILQTILTIIVISGLFQSVVAILQFIKQKSLGLTFLKESIFSVNDTGIAKIIIDGNVFIRSYGVFPHPNVLGGFLVISLLITMVYPLIFKSKMFHVEHFTYIWLYRAIIIVQLLALFLTFSKSAIGAFAVGLVMLVFGMYKMFHVEHLETNTQNVPRGTSGDQYAKCSTWNISVKYIFCYLRKMFHVEHFIVIFGIILTSIVMSVINLKYFIIQPIEERLFYLRSINVLFKEYLFEGLGIGQYVFDMQQFFSEKLLSWQLQPIHNVYLLIFSETGLVGFGLFLWFFMFVFLKSTKNVPRGTFGNQRTKCSTWNIWKPTRKMFHVEHFLDSGLAKSFESSKEIVLSYLFRSLLIVIAFIMFFDHYFWDIQQGQLLLWIIFALAVSKRY